MKQLFVFLFLSLIGPAVIAGDCVELSPLSKVRVDAAEKLGVRCTVCKLNIGWIHEHINDSILHLASGYQGQCKAKVSTTETKVFMCHNLGVANTNADPFTPSWEINGGYWQWGKKEMAAAGPRGPGRSNSNSDAISGWDTDEAQNGSWKDGVKTFKDPCPSGYRVPTIDEWERVIEYNAVIHVGTWEERISNYSSGIKVGDQLFLPAAGFRYGNDGALDGRGYYGLYWSSTENGSTGAWNLGFNSGYADTNNNSRTGGQSVRCIAE